MLIPEGSSKGSKRRCNNPKGKNQYQDRPPAGDPHIADILRGYHRQGITDRKELSKLFLSDYGISISETTIARRKRELGLRASHLTTLQLDDAFKRQLVLDQMAKDPSGKIGPRTVKKGIFEDTGIHLTRDWIIEEMRSLDPTAYASRGPAHAKARRRNRLELEAQRAEAEPSQERSVSPPYNGMSLDFDPPVPSSLQSHPNSPCQITYSAEHSQPESSQSHSSLTFVFERPPRSSQHSDSTPPDDDSDSDGPGVYGFPVPQRRPVTPDIPLRPSSSRQSVTVPYLMNPPEASIVPIEGRQDSSGLAVLEALERNTARIKTLTQLLSGADATQAQYGPSAFDSVMKCMEAAALLERQLARVASELQRQGADPLRH